MSRIKSWKCPQCPQNSARHWNLVTHIRRQHRGVGQPINKGIPSRGRNLVRTHINYPDPYNSSRNSINYHKQAIRGDGDIIDDTYRFFTEMEEKRRKLEKINEIASNFLPVPIQTPHTDSSAISLKDMVLGPPITPSQVNPHPKASVQTYITSNKTTIQKTSREKSLPRGETKSPSNEGGVSPPANVKEVFKFDMFGNFVDYYRVTKDLIEGLRDFVKQREKSNTLYQ